MTPHAVHPDSSRSTHDLALGAAHLHGMSRRKLLAVIVLAVLVSVGAVVPMLIMFIPLAPVFLVVYGALVLSLRSATMADTTREVVSVFVGLATGGAWWLSTMLVGFVIGIYGFMSPGSLSHWVPAWEVASFATAVGAALTSWSLARGTAPEGVLSPAG